MLRTDFTPEYTIGTIFGDVVAIVARLSTAHDKTVPAASKLASVWASVGVDAVAVVTVFA